LVGLENRIHPWKSKLREESVVLPQARKWRQSAEALQSKIAQRDSSDLAVWAEREQLRAAVRELGQASDAKAEAAKLHERVARARAKEVRLRSFRVLGLRESEGRANGCFLPVMPIDKVPDYAFFEILFLRGSDVWARDGFED
jgi:hypothetical protein